MTGLSVISYLLSPTFQKVLSPVSDAARNNTESENTRTSVLNYCPFGCHRVKVFKDSVSQFCHHEIAQNSTALIKRF